MGTVSLHDDVTGGGEKGAGTYIREVVEIEFIQLHGIHIRIQDNYTCNLYNKTQFQTDDSRESRKRGGCPMSAEITKSQPCGVHLIQTDRHCSLVIAC